MIVYGYVKECRYSGDGSFYIKVRIPSIHGPLNQSDYNGQKVRSYTLDKDLPWYPALLMPHMPQEDEVVAIASLNSGNSEFLVLGLTGGSYTSGSTNVGG